MKHLVLAGVLAMTAGMALAKLPPLDDAAKAKAAETAARQGWQAKVDGFQLCRAQDRVAAAYAKKGGKPTTTPVAAKAPAAAASGATPVANTGAPPPCADPGPFAYNAPEQKPLETAGAHSPTGTAASPPSVKPDSATMAPAQAKK